MRRPPGPMDAGRMDTPDLHEGTRLRELAANIFVTVLLVVAAAGVVRSVPTSPGARPGSTDNGAAPASPAPLADPGPLPQLSVPNADAAGYLFLVASAEAAERMRQSLEEERTVRAAASEAPRVAWVVALSSSEEGRLVEDVVHQDSAVAGALQIRVVDTRPSLSASPPQHQQ